MNAPYNDQGVAAELQLILDNQRQAFRAEGHVELATRIDRLDRCIALLVDNKQAICDAVDKDFQGRSPYVTQMMDIMNSIGSLKFVKKNLKKWMKPEKRSPFMPMNFLGAKAYVKYQPKGVVGIMTPWNVPVNMIFSPLADVLGAGNRAMIKPSEFTPHTAELMRKLFAQYFEETEISIVTGGPEVGAAFSALKLDHVIFTGATSIGRLVGKAAADNMVPVTLELGGKSPVIISPSADINKAAETIITGKSMNGGQLCVSPDYCFVPQSKLETFIKRCRDVIAEQFPRIQGNPDFVACINERHYERVKGYIDEAAERGMRIVTLCPPGEEMSAPAEHKLALHLIVNPDNDLACMQDEIFGAVLNIKTYDDLDPVLEFINDRERPLALYYFGEDEAEQARVLNETISGGVSINQIAMHVGCDDLPFGGIGHSGMGNYRGFDGFRTFSHARGVYREGWVNMAKLAGTLPPYGQKLDKMLDSQIKK
ncbi:coniferyl aldehyde dehydrogenase [Halioglobus japonicus]|uniref:Aldehyde dehydrogenase n=2 Tax=Halioglobus TaxID=1217416 RepID=A0AAP8SNE8_9GAMM|nr:coniferyl aldehyde dehydrogenase [Halioglobus japonicus]AQA18532.1 coniferyl aldehyde dehydrogenase [Halioglobus japonicus]PLW86552.1 coniferyl aldehyde dehydrogenase [Halioglobus japonicus]GHD12292.1 aldehyde dehydrogenase [Halioglobus japonicus]